MAELIRDKYLNRNPVLACIHCGAKWGREDASHGSHSGLQPYYGKTSPESKLLSSGCGPIFIGMRPKLARRTNLKQFEVSKLARLD
jgi:hypothetical protein